MFIYQTGKLDASELAGSKEYGKLHAKMLLEDDIGFVGTSNFDYRSRLFNNEMGFFFKDNDLAADCNKAFDALRDNSLRWGSPEWLEMRRLLMEQSGIKSMGLRQQRLLYKTLRATGMHWLF